MHIKNDAPAHAQPAYGPGLFYIMLYLFMGYAALISLQAKLKDRLGITPADVRATQAFQMCVASLFISNGAARIIHNYALRALQPPARIRVAVFCMSAAMALGGWVYAARARAWGALAAMHILGGLGVGIGETNLITVAGAYARPTQRNTQLGIAGGFISVTVIGFLLMDADVITPLHIYGFVCAALMLGFAASLAALAARWDDTVAVAWAASDARADPAAIPLLDFEFTGPGEEAPEAPEAPAHRAGERLCGATECALWRTYWRYFLIMALNMFVLNLSSSLNLYLFDGEVVTLWPARARVRHDRWFAALYLVQMLADGAARTAVFRARARAAPLRWAPLYALAAVALLAAPLVPLATLASSAFVFALNGALYASTTQVFKEGGFTPRTHALLTSFWFFTGDVGSAVASAGVQRVRSAWCAAPRVRAAGLCGL